MNLQSHMSGQFVGQAPNQASNQLPGMLQSNGNLLNTQVQNMSGQNYLPMDPEMVQMRRFMRERIYEMLRLRQSNLTENILKRIQDFTRRLEEGLYRAAATKEEYMNLDTLEARLHAMVKRAPPANHVPQHSQFINNTAPVATMMPIPGVGAGAGGSMSSTPSAGSLMPIGNAPFTGSLSNIGQQSASAFPMNSGVNSNVMAGQRPMNQMIPTPGLSGRNSQMLNNVDNFNNNGILSSVDSLMASQQMLQRQAGGQNNRMLPNLGRGMRSFAQHPFQNGIMNNVIGNNVRMVNDSGISTSSFGASSGSLFQPHGTLQQPLLQGDSSGSGSLFNIGNSVGSLLNNQNADQRTSSALVNSHLSQLNSQLSQSAAYLMQTNARQYQQLHQMPQQQQQFTTYPQQRQLSDLLANPLEASAQQRQPNDYSQISVRNEGFQLQSMSDNGNPVTSEYAMDHQNEVFQQSFSGHIQASELQNQLQYNSNEDISRDNQLSFIPSNSEPMMVDNDGVNEFGKPPFEAQQDVLLNLSHEQGAQEEFCQEIVGHANAQRINLPSEISSNDQIVAPGHVADQPKSGSGGMSSNGECDQNYRNQLRWLLFLRHARSCGAPPGKCLEPNCITVQKLLDHMDSCKAVSCSYPRCAKSSKLLNHQSSCRDYNCPVCAPYHKFIHAQKKLSARRDREAAEAKPTETLKPSETTVLPPEDTPIKRMKSELSSQFRSSENGSMYATVNAISASQPLQSVQSSENGKSDGYLQFKSEYRDLQADISNGSNQNNTDIENPSADIVSCQQFESDSVLNHVGSSPEEEIDKFVKENDQMKPEEEAHPSVDVSYRQRSDGVSVLNHVDSLPKEETDKHVKESGKLREEAGQPSEEVVTKSGKPNIKGVSLIELFTPEQVREHIYGLRRWVGQSKAKAERNQAMKQIMSENACQLCAVEKLSFEPPPIYCTPCGARIKRNAMYYTVGAGETRHVFCIPCYNESRGDAIVVDGTAIPKGRMEKKKNDEETEEWWVQCDKCEAWQHQICALFNGRRNDGGQAEYTCPNCYMQEVEQGERAPLPQSAVLGAKDLPTTVLSDHIEKRLARRLRQERLERARSLGKSYDEVPGADGIVVRVVSSVDKKLEVKPRFLEIFREENYPLEFPYKSKVVLLFQKIEGVEVCLYGMYVQEFGSECLQPNQRRVYLSYLDSVKYFRPEVRTVTGEALRTFVYHEILIGYLEYCKKRGFASCYIWACPPLKGEDYILYCHPEIQKTPKSDKLREWYLGMLRKAMRENIVVDLTNLYEHFFIQTGESKAKVTAARLPYFDGDYWPGAAEDMINQIIQEEEGRRLNKKGVTKKMITKRALKASGHLDLSSNASKDILLMHRLGETIAPMKEDFIMVHLQHACTHCCVLMVSGNRWVCELCKKFQLCDRCYAEEQRRDHRERHPVNQKDKHAHALKKIEVSGVTEDTKDTDDILESEFFDTRQAFLSLCQGNHYQYDTLRRAKHSSMMVLYHLHNPTAPAFVTTCNICHLDIETGQGWRCETCPEYDVCNACYKKDGGVDHPHKLTSYPSTAERDAQNKEARQIRVVQLRKMLELLVHASLCRSAQCQYPNCRKVKGLFRHGIQCKTRASGGCVLCKRMWYLLQLHARACKESECNVPRCRDLKDHLRRLQQQSDSRRRAAVNEMMRQRAQEVAGN